MNGDKEMIELLNTVCVHPQQMQRDFVIISC